MNKYITINQPIITKPFIVLSFIALIGVYFIIQRFVYGMGEVANLNGGFAWGIWVVYDVVIATGLACGGYVLAFMIYVFNKGQYHPLVRSAILASLLGYALGGFGAFFDMGRWWQFYNVFLPWNWNFNSVMLEVGLCISAYIIVLIIEFAPTYFEKHNMKNVSRALNKILFLIIALGVLLPTMHQSSLGSLLITMGHKVDPLWQTLQFQPLLAVLSAIIMGFSIIIFEASFVSIGFNRASETPILAKFSKVIVGLLIAFIAIRFIALIVQNKIGLIFAFDFASMMFLLELLLFIVPIVILSSTKNKQKGDKLLIAAISMIFSAALYRFDAFLFTLNPGVGYSYFPSFSEIMVTVGIIAIEILVYIVYVKVFPVLSMEHN